MPDAAHGAPSGTFPARWNLWIELAAHARRRVRAPPRGRSCTVWKHCDWKGAWIAAGLLRPVRGCPGLAVPRPRRCGASVELRVWESLEPIERPLPLVRSSSRPLTPSTPACRKQRGCQSDRRGDREPKSGPHPSRAGATLVLARRHRRGAGRLWCPSDDRGHLVVPKPECGTSIRIECGNRGEEPIGFQTQGFRTQGVSIRPWSHRPDASAAQRRPGATRSIRTAEAGPDRDRPEAAGSRPLLGARR